MCSSKDITRVSPFSMGFNQFSEYLQEEVHQLQQRTKMAELNSELNSELNINRRLPPELLTRIFKFLPFSDLNNVLLVCRLNGRNEKLKLYSFLGGGGSWERSQSCGPT